MRLFSHRMPARGGAGLLLAAAVTFAVVGCSQPTASLAQSATDARSAASSAELAVEQQSSDRTLLTVTQTALEDARTHLLDAEKAAAEADASTSDETVSQQQTLDDIRAATDAVLAAQQAVATDAASALPALRKTTDDLAALTDTLDGAAGQ